MKFRYLGEIWSVIKLFENHPDLIWRKIEIMNLRIGDSLAVVPRFAVKAYTVTRVR